MTVNPAELERVQKQIANAPRTPIPVGLQRTPDARAWAPRDEALLATLAFVQDLQQQLNVLTTKVGISVTWPAGATVAAGGGQALFELPIPTPFITLNALNFIVSAITPGVGISSFDVALYNTEANRDAGTYSTADTGIQVLGPGLATASAGPATARWAALGRVQGSLKGATPVLWGRVRNNDAANVFTGSIAAEAYGQPGQRAT